jgi:methyl-accepting chemotaxis protein
MFNNLKVSVRIHLLSLIMVLLTVTLVWVGYSTVTRIASSAVDARAAEGNRILAAGSNAIWELRFGSANYTFATPENRKSIVAGRAKLYETLEERLKNYAALSA